mgnify:CR=1 FL=1
MPTLRLPAIATLFSLVALMAPAPSLALSCAPPPSFAEAVEQYDTVIEAWPTRLIKTNETSYAWEIEVGTVYKGNVTANAKTAIMESVWPSTKDRMSSLQEGEHMLLFLYRSQQADVLTYGLCDDKSRSLDDKPLTQEEKRILEGAPAESFSDVPTAHPNAEAIAYVFEQGIVHGYPDGRYKPNLPINRAEFVKILTGVYQDILEEKHSDGSWEDSMCIAVFSDSEITLPFADVREDAWYAGSVCTAMSQGLVNGYPDGTFRPANNINFAEAAKIIVKTFNIGSAQSEAELEGEAEHPGQFWYKPFADDLANRNAIPTSVAHFDHEVTRGEMAEIIYRLKSGISTKASQTYDDLAPQGTAQDEFGS